MFLQVFADPGAGDYDTCSLMPASSKQHTLPLAAAASGTEICIKDASGSVGLLVIATKSTALPEQAFLTSELTVWRDAS